MIRSVSPRMAKHVNKMMAQSEHWEPVLRQYVTRLRSGFWDNDYVKSLFQLAYGNTDVYAAYCFAHVHAWIGIGKVLMAAIDIGLEPLADHMVEENNNLLAALPSPFFGAFWGSNHDSDGYIKWNESVEFGQMDCTGREIVVAIRPYSLPLEVGFTRPDTTVYHILRERGVARWPYGSKRIHLLVRNPNWPNYRFD
jgi:hypothetical protein